MTKSTELKVKKPSPTGAGQMKRSQSTPRVNSILKLSNSVTNGMSSIKNGITNKTEKKSMEKKSVTIVQNGDQKKSRSNVAVLKSRPSLANQTHYNIQNIYAPDNAVKGMKNKVY